MKTEKKKRGRPPKHKAMEFEGMTYEGAINHALDQEVRAELGRYPCTQVREPAYR